MSFSLLNLKRLSSFLILAVLLVGSIPTSMNFAAADDHKNKSDNDKSKSNDDHEKDKDHDDHALSVIAKLQWEMLLQV